MNQSDPHDDRPVDTALPKLPGIGRGQPLDIRGECRGSIGLEVSGWELRLAFTLLGRRTGSRL
jgi:hypothetical protein